MHFEMQIMGSHFRDNKFDGFLSHKCVSTNKQLGVISNENTSDLFKEVNWCFQSSKKLLVLRPYILVIV